VVVEDVKYEAEKSKASAANAILGESRVAEGGKIK
jgi:hypothetical protein